MHTIWHQSCLDQERDELNVYLTETWLFMIHVVKFQELILHPIINIRVCLISRRTYFWSSSFSWLIWSGIGAADWNCESLRPFSITGNGIYFLNASFDRSSICFAFLILFLQCRRICGFWTNTLRGLSKTTSVFVKSE